jgi:hypothetical protein
MAVRAERGEGAADGRGGEAVTAVHLGTLAVGFGEEAVELQQWLLLHVWGPLLAFFLVRRRLPGLVGAFCARLAATRRHYRLVVAIVTGIVLAAVLFPAFLRLDFCPRPDDEVRDEGNELLGLLAHAVGHAAEGVAHVLVVLETVVPDEVEVVDEISLGLELKALELLGHGPEVHGLFDDCGVLDGAFRRGAM